MLHSYEEWSRGNASQPIVKIGFNEYRSVLTTVGTCAMTFDKPIEAVELNNDLEFFDKLLEEEEDVIKHLERELGMK